MSRPKNERGIVSDVVDFDKVGIAVQFTEPDGSVKRAGVLMNAQAALDFASQLKQNAKKARAWAAMRDKS
jgi:hypothetical protein